MATKKDQLKHYESKRNFAHTPEPSARMHTHESESRFVVQKHDARSLHYDFRLEYNGVMASWAIPKGPSTNPQDKRFAVRTEDHPLAYRTFEGTIPEGNYGAGTVLVWDAGTFINLKAPLSLAECLANGEITVWLKGEKLRGGYALVRISTHPKENWLFIKMNDSKADRDHSIIEDKPDSVLKH